MENLKCAYCKIPATNFYCYDCSTKTCCVCEKKKCDPKTGLYDADGLYTCVQCIHIKEECLHCEVATSLAEGGLHDEENEMICKNCWK